MQPTAPAPLTRAAARSRARVADPSRNRARVVRALALSGGAFVGAFIVLGIGSLAGIPSDDSPVPPMSETEQIAVPTPRSTTATPSRSATPSPNSSPSADATPTDAEPDTVAPVGVAPQPAPEPAASETVVVPETGDTAESERGKSGLAPGRTKPPTKP